MRFLFIGSRFMLHASFPRSVALTQLRLTLLTVTSSQRDLHPQVCAHAGRTTAKRLPKEPFLELSDRVRRQRVQAALTFKRQACSKGSV
jgi:hypothetical protein